MDIRKWREEAGVSQATLAQHLGVNQSQISRFEEDPEAIPFGILKRWLARLGVDPGRVDAVAQEIPPSPVDVGEPYSGLRRSLELVEAYCRRERETETAGRRPWMEGLPSVEEFEQFVSESRRKPRLVLAGRSDAGKSRIANSLLGRNLLPTQYGPATRLVTTVHHLEDRPSWLKGVEVLITRPGTSLGDLARDDDARRVRHSGGYDLLQEHVVYRGNDAAGGEANEVFVFADAPILRAATLIDLPGSRGETGSADADALRAADAAQRADVLIYASPVQGFLNGLDFEFLSRFIPSLPPYEKETSFPILGNLFIVATHAAPHIGFEELERDIISRGRANLWKHVNETSVVMRSAAIGRPIVRTELDARFFAFWAERRELRDRLHSAVGEILGTHVPAVVLRRAEQRMSALRTRAIDAYQSQSDSLRTMLDDVDRAQRDHEALVASQSITEALRRRAQDSGVAQYRNVSVAAQHSLKKAWQSRTTPEAIEKMILERFPIEAGKEQAKQYAAAGVLELIRRDVFRECAPLVSALPRKVDPSHQSYVYVPGVEIPGDEQGFVAAIAGAGVATLAGMTGGLSLIVGGLLWTLVGDSWQARLAKNIASEIQKRGLHQQFASALELYWSRQMNDFIQHARVAEQAADRDVQRRAAQLEMAHRDKRELEKQRSWLEERRAFFKGIPAIAPPRDG